ncbi:MAG: Txe/YoeB family addiction module toxin [Cyanobacteriota bacterium]
MSEWKILYTSDALKDKRKAFEAGFKDKINSLLDILRENPYTTYPPFEKLIGNYTGAYSRRINRQHRLVYSIYKDEKIIKIISMWSHYE